MAAQELSLRSTLAGLTTVVGLLALLVSGALVALTTALHRTTEGAASAVESVRLAEEAEIALLLHERTDDPLVRRDYEEDLRHRLVDAERFVFTEHEARVLAAAVARVDEYLTSLRDPDLPQAERAARQEAAYGALEAFVEVNLAHAREAQRSAAGWDRIADALGIGVGTLLILVAGGILVWLQRGAFAPVLSVAAAMERFGRGDRAARAEERGPTELRNIGRRFNEMAEALAAERQAQVAFLGGVAHDLRNPLAVLKLAAAAVRADEPLPPEPRLRQVFQKFERQVTRLERMVGDFLDMAKIEAGELELVLEACDARALVHDAVDLFAGASPEHRLDVAVPADALPTSCDHLRMEQVVTNLISNAIKYSPRGSAVEVAAEARGDEVVLRVTDEGVGISAADQRRLFEPFRRVGLSRETVPGVGLGLFVVRRIVEAHGGHIEVESAPGAGSTFRVCLPRRGDFDGTPSHPLTH